MVGQDKNRRKWKVERCALPRREKQMEEKKGRKPEGKRNGNQKERKRETNVIFFQDLGQVFQTLLNF